ncbi:MAG: hypothetical protein HQK50_17975 [Oligoflexia bacterium]|nr:hypothetical protein [Oligoflexia bacterium]MBF0367467.1 hypothetical protein [Oligoflexia bacterium]
MWQVKLTEKAEKELMRNLKKGVFTNEDIEVLKLWIQHMEKLGPDVLKEMSRWDDHALHREWLGYRSSCFSYSGRIIYRVIEHKIIVEVVRVTKDHDYSKKD